MAARYFEDNDHAEAYAKFRISPPLSFISRIVDFLQEEYSGPLTSTVDVGCGSGQSTVPLAKFFTNVHGFDVSPAQIKEALEKNELKNVSFKEGPAESLPFENDSVQLITSSMACHYFDLPKFYKESERILVRNGILALYAYTFPRILWKDKDLYDFLISVYNDDMKGYWTDERLYVENCYTDEIFNIPFGQLVREDNFVMEKKATIRDIEGSITTWSGFHRYKTQNGEEASQKILDNFVKNVMEAIGEDRKPEDTEVTLRYKFFLVMGRKTG